MVASTMRDCIHRRFIRRPKAAGAVQALPGGGAAAISRAIV
jgi:hypothetical protein